jgi:pyrroline-5-carboxylate reductase
VTIAIIGGGMLGETVLAGLIRSGTSAAEIVVAEKRPERAAELIERHGVSVDSLTGAVAQADTVFLVVKPQDMATVLDEMSPAVRPDAVVISLAAGITTAFIEDRLPSGTVVVRVMPNTPSQVGQGMAAISGGRHSGDNHVAQVDRLMSSVGRTVRVSEEQQDAVTAVSGSGPAYLFYVVEALIDSGVELGLSRETATELVVQTMLGAATMLRETSTSAEDLRRQVTSPNGTTAAAIGVLDEANLRQTWQNALQAARDRSRELAAGG